MLKSKILFPLNLQYFADGDDNGNENKNVEGNDNQNSDNEGNGNKDQTDNSGEKTFTQTQVNNMMAKEKNEGKRSILKSLGFNSEDDAKKAIELYNALVNSQKTNEEKTKDEIDKVNQEKEDSVKRAEIAESKLLCFETGVSKDCIDDVLAIANAKLVDGKTLDVVLKEMKKDNKYSVFFEGTSKGNTGGDPGHNGSHFLGNGGDYGKTLAQGQNNIGKKTGEVKSNFF